MSSTTHPMSSTMLQHIDLMTDLQPVFHSIAVFLRILQWKGDEKKYSFICMISLILARSIQQYILYSLPCVVIMLKIYQQHHQMNSHHQQQHNKADELALLYDLIEIRDKLCFLTIVKNWMQQCDTLCSVYHIYYSMASKKIRLFICAGMSCLFTIVYAGWVILLHQQQIHSSSLIWFALLMIMCAHSPWIQSIQTACVRAILPLIPSMAKGSIADSNLMKDEQARNQKIYRFEIYHHQRWWFPTGWSSLLLPQDRAAWTDAHLETTPSINNFCLPPKTTSTLLETCQQKTVSWAWVDPKWSRYQDTTTDRNGWEYGNWHWKQWSSQSIGLGICTRRQKWYRDAQRTEYFIQLPTDHHHQQQQDEAAIWDNQSITTNNSSIMTPVDPIIVSFDNKGERMLRRRSSNLSSKGVTFNDTLDVCSSSPSADDLYSKYCKSPKPQTLERFSI